ncbi:MAG: NAD(P)-dependent oxidoreductase [Planctomycetaceae bacterium]|nr:NAD(P)-dependent oxidoreductase [Planctomycetaceae bacterium]
MSTDRPVGLIGLGLLGSAIGDRLRAAGYSVVGFDVDPRRRDEFTLAGGEPVSHASQVPENCRRIVLSLPTSDIVDQVLNDIAPRLKLGDLIIDTTTGAPEDSEQVGESLAKRGVGYVDATVAGSSRQVRAGDVVVMAGGSDRDIAASRDVLASFARTVFAVGPCGSGARMKLAVNLVLGLHRAVLAEGLAFARACGLDPRQTLEILKSGPAASRVMDIKGERMLTGDFAPEARLAQHLKDVRLILDAGHHSAARLPFSELHAELLQTLVDQGWGDFDNSAVLRAFESNDE